MVKAHLNTPEVKKKRRETMQRKFANGELKIWNAGLTIEKDSRISKSGFKKGYTPWHKGLSIGSMSGKHHSIETKEKIRRTRLERNIKSNMNGTIKYRREHNGTWNKGLTKETDNRINQYGLKGSKTKKRLFTEGKLIHPWIGRHHTIETKIKIGRVHLGNKYNVGKHLSKETKEKIRKANLGKRLSIEHKNKFCKSLVGKKQSLEWIRKRTEHRRGSKLSFDTIKKIKEKRAKQINPKYDTTIELKIQDYLKQLQIPFFTHQYINEIEHAYQCDILIPSMNLVIECDGDYWHKYPIGKEIDHIRTSELLDKGFKVLRLWENEIKIMSIEDLKKQMGVEA